MAVSLDSLVTNPGRLSILMALAVEEKQDFVELRRRTQLTDGNLASHAKRLATGGLIDVTKSFRNGKPVTCLTLTVAGRSALEAHARRVLAAISHRRVSFGPAVVATPVPEISPIESGSSKTGDSTPPTGTTGGSPVLNGVARPDTSTELRRSPDDDWVD